MLEQLLKYGSVSILANGAGISVVWVVTRLEYPLELAMGFGFIIAIFVAHHFNRNWTFEYTGSYTASLMRYYISNLGLLAMQMGAASLLVRVFHFPPFLTACLVLLIFGALGYAAAKWFAFWKQKKR